MFISVICPIYNEEKYISQCIESIVNQDIDKNLIEVIFVDGMSTDSTREIINSYKEKYSFIRLLENPDRVVPPALNKAILESKGSYIIRLDAHCKYPENYISQLIYYAEKLNSDNVGAVCKTLPATSTSKSLAISIGMSHKFGVGNSSFRVGVNSIQKVDTVPFGCFKRELFDTIGLFDLELIRNQDDEFNGRIIKNGGSIYLIPDLVIDYYARDNFTKLFKMFYQYGLFKPLVNKKLKIPATLRQFFPLLFLLGIFLGGIISLFFPVLFYVYFSVLILYLLLDIYFSIVECIKNKSINIFPFLLLVFPIIHISYGWGYLAGIIKILRKKPFYVSSSR